MSGSDVADFYDDFSRRLLADYFVPNARVHAQYCFLRRAIADGTRSILIVGCGTGEVAWILAQRFSDARILALDISQQNIDSARSLFAHPRVEYRCADVLAWQQPAGDDELFEIVIFPDSYEHIRIADRAALHAVLARLLAARGKLLLACPSVMKQQALRQAGEGLQVVDEDVRLEDVQRLAEDVQGGVSYFAMARVWGDYDYFHAVIERGLSELRAPSSSPALELQRGQPGWRRRLAGAGERLRLLGHPPRTARALRIAAARSTPDQVKQALLNVVKPALAGGACRCSVCDFELRAFLPFGVGLSWRKGALCPNCQSLERHRLVWLLLRERITAQPPRLLHVAPEPCLRPRLERLLGEHYVTLDAAAPDVDVRGSLEALPFADGSFDAVICSHVLEHVTDDRRAMRELWRVLTPGSWAVLQVPVARGQAVTFEDPSITSAAERRRHFGQHDHVRSYGADYADRLRESGFQVTTSRVTNSFGAEEIRRWGLDANELFYHVTRP